MSDQPKPDYWGNPEAAFKAGLEQGRAESAAMLEKAAQECNRATITFPSGMKLLPTRDEVAASIRALIPTDYAAALEEHDSEIVKPMLALIEKWDEIILAFTSNVYTVKKPMNAVQVLKDARFDLETAIAEALK
jgi:hypothetical protein